MALSSDLISQFVKATNDNSKNTPTETTVYGTTVHYNGKTYVKIDGSDLLTPISTTASMNEGDRVTVLIKDHSATVTGNVSDPSASSKTVEKQGSRISEFEIVMAYKVTTEDLEAVNAAIENLRATTARLDDALIVEAEIEKLEALFADIEYLTASDLDVITAQIETLEAEFGSFSDISTEDLEAVNATITSLKGYTANFTYLTVGVLDAMAANIKDLEVNKLSATDADLKYVNIDFANIDKAWMAEFYSKSGLIENVIMGDGTVTGYLVGVTIRGDVIEGGTVIAEKLVIKGEDGLYYKLNTDGVTTEAEQTEYNSLNGSVITAKSVTAEKISVSDLVAFDATIGGFVINDNSIHSYAKNDVGNSTSGIYMDNEGQVSFGDADNYIRYRKHTKSLGTVKLRASYEEITYDYDGDGTPDNGDYVYRETGDIVTQDAIDAILAEEGGHDQRINQTYENGLVVHEVSSRISASIYYYEKELTEDYYTLEIAAESILFGSGEKSSVDDIRALTEHVSVGTHVEKDTKYYFAGYMTVLGDRYYFKPIEPLSESTSNKLANGTYTLEPTDYYISLFYEVEYDADSDIYTSTDIENPNVDYATIDSTYTYTTDGYPLFIDETGRYYCAKLSDIPVYTYHIGNGYMCCCIIETINEQPCIELSEDDTAFKMRLTNTSVTYMENDTPSTEISKDGIKSDNVTVNDEFRHGECVWAFRQNGNYCLTWKESDS